MVIGIEYDEVNQASYEGVYLYVKDTRLMFNSGFPDVDMVRAINYVWDLYPDEHIVFSSTFDHFLMDGDGFVLENFMGSEWLVRVDLSFEELIPIARAYVAEDRLAREKVRLSGITVRSQPKGPKETAPFLWGA